MRNDLLVPFEDSPENRDVFLRDIKPQVSCLLYPQIEAKVMEGEIFRVCHSALKTIFAPMPGKERYGCLNLAQEEVECLHYLDGTRTQDVISLTTVESFVELVTKPFRRRLVSPADHEYRKPTPDIAPSIWLDGLKALHPEAFNEKRYPGLRESIIANPLLIRRVNSARGRYEETSGTDLQPGF